MKIIELLIYIFGRPIFYKFNRLIVYFGLRNMGVLNYKTGVLNGEAEFLTKFLSSRENPIVFDVGANVGNYAKSVISINQGVQIYCFEPSPRTFDVLKEECTSAKCYDIALSSDVGSSKIYDLEDALSEHASMYESVISDLHFQEPISYTINTTTLDRFASEENVGSIQLLKIDTEGHELEVLKGCKEYISTGKIDCIQLEFNSMNIVSKTSFKDIWDMLSKYYTIYRLLPRGRLLKMEYYSPLFNEIYAFQNIICLRKVR